MSFLYHEQRRYVTPVSGHFLRNFLFFFFTRFVSSMRRCLSVGTTSDCICRGKRLYLTAIDHRSYSYLPWATPVSNTDHIERVSVLGHASPPLKWTTPLTCVTWTTPPSHKHQPSHIGHAPILHRRRPRLTRTTPLSLNGTRPFSLIKPRPFASRGRALTTTHKTASHTGHAPFYPDYAP